MQKAFTLIEIIVVVMIMTIFFVGGFTTYTREIQNRQLDREVDAFVTTLKLLREKSVNRDLSVRPDCQNFLRFYTAVRVSTDPDSYRRGFDCNPPPSGSRYTPFGDTSLQYTEFISPTVDTTISFYYPMGCTNAACNAADIRVRFKNSNINKCKEVIINRLGTVNVQDIVCP